MFRVLTSALALTLLLAGAARAAEAQQFNLVCSGSTTGVVDPREPRQLDTPRTRWYRYNAQIN